MNTRFFGATLAAVILAATTCRAELNWLTDYNAALKQAKAEDKVVLAAFTGSDWCPDCMRLKSEVLDEPEFAAFASTNLVLLEVDFPKEKTLKPAQRSANEKLAARYAVENFPTVLVLNDTGHPLAQVEYEKGGSSSFIEGLRKIQGVSWKAPNGSVDISLAKKSGPDAPLWGGTVFPPKRYDEIKLTGLSGSGNRRLAIVNNQTFAPGETARVKLKGGEVKVLCKEIRAKSIVVQVEGSADVKELFLEGK